GDKLVVIDFFATWCGPCKVISPQFEQMSKEFENVAFYKLDVDENQAVAAEYDVRAMPTFLFFKNGEKVEDVVGANPKKLRVRFDPLQYFGPSCELMCQRLQLRKTAHKKVMWEVRVCCVLSCTAATVYIE
ncbi:thioredoxin-domain-containing protein, partial [Wilcoxina mikolae CBS 423.85]